MSGHTHPRRILMTVDAVGGVWRYAMDAARALRLEGVATLFTGLGPPPSRQMIEEARAIGELEWLDAPLDWMVRDPAALSQVPAMLAELASARGVDLLHLNLPSQAAGLSVDLPVVVVSHSCVGTWFASVRGTLLPADWQWQEDINRRGLTAADAIVAPSRSHADAVARIYGVTAIDIVHNASGHVPTQLGKKDYVFAAGRWWDEGKNAAALDIAASLCRRPVVAAGPTEGPNGEQFSFAHVDDRGPLGHREAMALMSEAAIFVSPSIYEPFGLAALEAARSGAALVLADIPTYRELWADAALFADSADPASFAEAIDRLADDRRLRRRIALAAQEKSRQFSLRNQADCLLAIYRRVAEGQRKLTAAE